MVRVTQASLNAFLEGDLTEEEGFLLEHSLYRNFNNVTQSVLKWSRIPYQSGTFAKIVNHEGSFCSDLRFSSPDGAHLLYVFEQADGSLLSTSDPIPYFNAIPLIWLIDDFDYLTPFIKKMASMSRAPSQNNAKEYIRTALSDDAVSALKSRWHTDPAFISLKEILLNALNSQSSEMTTQALNEIDGPRSPSPGIVRYEFQDNYGFDSFYDLTDLRGFDFQGMLLKNCDFSFCSLDYCNFDCAQLQNIQLQNSSLFNASFREARMTQIQASSCDATEADFSGTVCHKVFLVGAGLKRTKWAKVFARNLVLDHSCALDADFEGIVFSDLSSIFEVQLTLNTLLLNNGTAYSPWDLRGMPYWV